MVLHKLCYIFITLNIIGFPEEIVSLITFFIAIFSFSLQLFERYFIDLF